MTREDFLKALKALGEQGTDLVSYFEESETASREEVGKRNRENKNLRDRLKATEEGSAPAKEKLETILAKLGLDTDSDADVVETAIDKLVTGKGGNESVNTLQKRLDRLERERKTEREKLEAETKSERSKRHDILRQKELQEALMANKAINPDQLAKMLLGMTKVRDDDDSIVYLNDKGEEVAVKDGVKAYLDAYPAFRLNDQKGGAGSGGGNGNTGGKPNDPGVELARSLAKQGADADKSAADAQASFFKPVG
jgi:hypothetical protein